MSIFGNRLKELREKTGEKQADVGNLIGKTAAAVSKYEKGDREPELEDIINLVKYFGTTADYMLGLSNVNYSAENIAVNVKNIMGDLSVEDFVREIERKTGKFVSARDIEDCISGRGVSSIEFLDILASYAGVETLFFYKYPNRNTTDIYSCTEMEELDKYKESPVFKDALRLTLKVLRHNLDVSPVEKIIDGVIQLKKGVST